MKGRNEFKSGAIPSIFHHVWVGGEIEEGDLESIIKLSRASRSSGFKTVLWTDDEKHIQKTFDEMTLKEGSGNIDATLRSLNVEVRNINTLLENLKTNPIFSNKETNDLIINTIREAIGHRNLASVSDLVRYCALYYEGGYYLDTDLRPQLTKDTKFKADEPALGFVGKFSPTLEGYQDLLRRMGRPYKVDNVAGNNDAFGAISKHPILRVAIKKTLTTYAKFDAERTLLTDLDFFPDRIEASNIILNAFDKDFLDRLSNERNKLLKTKFINALLDISFNLRLLNNRKAQTPAQQDDINHKKAALIKSSEKLIEDTSHALGLNPVNSDVGKTSQMLLKYINLKVKEHQKQFGFGYENATEMDAKRYPFQVGTIDKYNKRRSHTIKTAIYSLCDAIAEFLLYNDKKGSSTYSEKEMATFPVETFTGSKFKENVRELSASADDEEITLAGCTIKFHYANSWVKAKEKKPVSYDDSVLPYKTKQAFFNTTVSKVSKAKDMEKSELTSTMGM
ncbi:TcdA/TcdB catalytic glycosyltransferase domain-containing protein [Legionella cardiaca]|uniref:TcdA/TcdB catalytic glycosyltransferase domain-containing protein n=1 Tax=Legionella cardiaca TaxID=1071983 RepID=A0ABY8AT36_9GAMM|nr:TcdA/TcdB catalytic glycosyltransferase domain-containing protein [Legionella cardiaca]WED43718.1 TcdA/TcdB catalytic glycosyltransferase domain-containing protein [Legionella cardiaca]